MRLINHALIHWIDFLVTMTQKELNVRYKNTVAGFLWVFVNPILQMLVIGLVFQHFVPQNEDNYFLFLFAGLLPWNFFSMTIAKTTPAFFFERNLIQKAKFPREIIVLSIIFSNYFNFLLSISILAVIAVLFFGTTFVSLLLLLPATAWLFLLVIGLSLLTASLNVRFRDMQFFVQATLPLWFYATPIVYSASFLPEPLQQVLMINPVYWVINSYQRVFVQHASPFSPTHLLSMFTGFIIIVIGLIVYQRTQKNFDDWL